MQISDVRTRGEVTMGVAASATTYVGHSSQPHDPQSLSTTFHTENNETKQTVLTVWSLVSMNPDIIILSVL
jgi:hypothetical protein